MIRADAIGHYLTTEKGNLLAAEPGTWKRIVRRLDTNGSRIDRLPHRNIISAVLVLWVISVMGYIAILVVGVPSLDSQIVQWRDLLIVIQVVIGGLIIAAGIAWLTGNEESGLRYAVLGSLLSLIALQSLYFYLSQFAAITTTFLQFAFLLILLAYRRWYLGEQSSELV